MKIKWLLSVILLWCSVLLVGCSDNSQVFVEGLILEEENVMTFSDGESVNLWRGEIFGDSIYKLSNDTALLTIREPSGPQLPYASNMENSDDLSESTQKAINDFYEEQGLLYDIQAELEKAYEEYLFFKENEKVYQARYISQDIVQTASNDNIICFLTTVTLPIKESMVQELRLGAIFDRKTGESLSNWDIFDMTEKEAQQWLIGKIVVDDSTLKNEMEAALKPEYIIMFPKRLEISFPHGTLPSQEHSYGTGFDYFELLDVLQYWAIPN